MLLHLIESSRHRSWYSGPTLWSAGAHAALIASVVLGARSGEPERASGEQQREVVYFLPLLPAATERPKAERLDYAADLPGAGVPPRDGFATLPVGGGVRGTDTGLEAAVPVEAAASDSGDASSSPVYLEADLDMPVERDPSSAGPRYPDELRMKNVEGQVIAEWIVDTTGRADSSSFRVIESTHPLFTRAIREILPAMNFRPAELMGKRVRQLVRQQFRFVIERPARDSATGGRKGISGEAGAGGAWRPSSGPERRGLNGVA